MSDFASEYGVRLATAPLSWREFLLLLQGLMAADTRLSRRFAAREQPFTATDFNPEV